MESPAFVAEQHYILEHPVSFKLSLAKRPLVAQFVSASFEPGLGYILKITFSDGHEDRYELCEFGIYTSSGVADQYCKALQKEIHAPLGCWTSSSKVYVLNYPVGGKDMNIWITGYVNDDYSVYYGNEFKFDIKNQNGQWFTRVHEWQGEFEIDKGLLKKVINALNYYTA